MFTYEANYFSKQPQLFFQAWHPPSRVQGVILIAHGFGGHGGQFTNAAEAWVKSDFSIYALDFRGHGHSEGPRGYIRQWSDFLTDLQQLFKQAHVRYPKLPFILWGHSLGGLIALDYALQHSDALAGLVLTAPAVGKTGVSPTKFALGQLLSKLLPQFSLDVGFDPRACSRDPQIVAQYNADPLHHSRGSARLSTEFHRAQASVLANVSELSTPTLILHGGGDRITNPQSSAALYKTLTMRDRQFIQYPHAYHELHLDINRQEVLRDMLQWMTHHCNAPSIFQTLG